MLTYAMIAKHYSAHPPQGLPTKYKNTCAARVSYALYGADNRFFKDVTAKGGTGAEWFGLPLRASELAIILNKKIRIAERIKSAAEISCPRKRQGIIFFDKIPGYAGTGHISLWTGLKVFDNGDYFGKSPRVYFWVLS